MTTKAGTRLQLTVKAEQMRKLHALQDGSYLSTSQLFMMMIDAFYKKRFGTDAVENTQEYDDA